jgi:hypothetical protein
MHALEIAARVTQSSLDVGATVLLGELAPFRTNRTIRLVSNS